MPSIRRRINDHGTVQSNRFHSSPSNYELPGLGMLCSYGRTSSCWGSNCSNFCAAAACSSEFNTLTSGNHQLPQSPVSNHLTIIIRFTNSCPMIIILQHFSCNPNWRQPSDCQKYVGMFNGLNHLYQQIRTTNSTNIPIRHHQAPLSTISSNHHINQLNKQLTNMLIQQLVNQQT